MNLAQETSLVMASLTVLGQALILIILFSYLFKWEFILSRIKGRALYFAFIVALIATGGSLWYSEVVGFAPCELCWWQRIFMYPQVLLLGIAAAKRDVKIRVYAGIMAIMGGLIAIRHYLMQIGAVEVTGCSTVGYSVNCAENFGMTFGYVTIPLMSLTAFVLIITLLSLIKIEE